MSHTPGPWDAHKGRDNEGEKEGVWGSVKGAGYHLARIWSDTSTLEAEAESNARLMAASPDLLQALEAVEKLFATPGYYIGTRDGADPLAIDATFALVAQAVRAAKGE